MGVSVKILFTQVEKTAFPTTSSSTFLGNFLLSKVTFFVHCQQMQTHELFVILIMLKPE
jgi:hypothetical protein